MTRAHKISNRCRPSASLRLAWHAVEISPERQAEKQAPKRTAVAA